jgi:excisionase family DNA binding protein
MDTAILISISEATQRVSIGRSRMYEILAAGEVRSVKCGRRRLVDAASLTAWTASLPESQLKQVSVKG